MLDKSKFYDIQVLRFLLSIFFCRILTSCFPGFLGCWPLNTVRAIRTTDGQLYPCIVPKPRKSARGKAQNRPRGPEKAGKRARSLERPKKGKRPRKGWEEAQKPTKGSEEARGPRKAQQRPQDQKCCPKSRKNSTSPQKGKCAKVSKSKFFFPGPGG